MSRDASTLKTPWEYADELLAVAHEALEDTEDGSVDLRFRIWGRPAAPTPGCEQLTVSGWSLGELGTLTPTVGGVGKRHVTGRVNLLGFLVTLFRCAATFDEQGNPPTSEQIEDASEPMFDSVWAIWTRVYQEMRAGDLFDGRCMELFFDGARALDTSGGLHGAEIEFRAEIDGIVAGGS